MIARPDVTVAICTRNRAADLRITLEGIRNLRHEHGRTWELLVVDNQSTDETQEVLESFRDLPLRVAIEETPGVAHARNRVLAEAAAPFLVCTDDDATVDPGWLDAHCAAEEKYREASFYGGPSRPQFEEPVPDWFAENWKMVRNVYALLDLGSVPRVLHEYHLPYGVNMSMRTTAARTVGYPTERGHWKRQIGLGEETALFAEMVARGDHGKWVPEAVVYHRIRRSRITHEYIGRYYRALGRDTILDHEGPRWPRAVQCLLDAGAGYLVARFYALTGLSSRQHLRTYRRAHKQWGRVQALLGERGRSERE